MKIKILTLLFVLSYSGVVYSACSDGFDFDCFYDVLFGEDESSEEESVEEIHTNFNHSSLSSVIHNAEEKLEQIPKIVAYLKKLTDTVTHVQHELIGNGNKLPSHSLNEIEKEEEEEEEEEERNSKKSSNSSPESSEEIFEKGDKKNERLISIDKESASKLNKIPRLVADVSLLNTMVKALAEQIAKNVLNSKAEEKEKKEETSQELKVEAAKLQDSEEKKSEDETKIAESNAEVDG